MRLPPGADAVCGASTRAPGGGPTLTVTGRYLNDWLPEVVLTKGQEATIRYSPGGSSAGTVMTLFHEPAADRRGALPTALGALRPTKTPKAVGSAQIGREPV